MMMYKTAQRHGMLKAQRRVEGNKFTLCLFSSVSLFFLVMPFSPEVLRAQSISGELVRRVIENYVKKTVPSYIDATTEFKDLKQNYSVPFEECYLTVSSVNSVAMKGLVTFLVKVHPRSESMSRQGGKNGNDETIPVTVKIRTFQNVLLATSMLKPHDEVKSDEVNVVKTESTDLSNPVVDLSQLKNKWTSRWIQSGKALTFDMFDDVPVVKRGDNVTIIFKTKNIVVREEGSALQDGKINDIIGVTNEYRDNLRGKVTGKSEVVLVN